MGFDRVVLLEIQSALGRFILRSSLSMKRRSDSEVHGQVRAARVFCSHPRASIEVSKDQASQRCSRPHSLPRLTFSNLIRIVANTSESANKREGNYVASLLPFSIRN